MTRGEVHKAWEDGTWLVADGLGIVTIFNASGDHFWVSRRGGSFGAHSVHSKAIHLATAKDLIELDDD